MADCKSILERDIMICVCKPFIFPWIGPINHLPLRCQYYCSLGSSENTAGWKVGHLSTNGNIQEKLLDCWWVDYYVIMPFLSAWSCSITVLGVVRDFETLNICWGIIIAQKFFIIAVLYKQFLKKIKIPLKSKCMFDKSCQCTNKQWNKKWSFK